MSKYVALMMGITLVACAPAVWDRPGTTPEQFARDAAHCELAANMATPNEDDTSPFNTLSQNVGASMADGIVMGIEKAHNYQLCMTSVGYTRRQ